MTAPAHDALLITLLALFTACTGYAAGRLHQWYRTGLDRDEAYRDGYDTATRSVFSLAARLISPRRGVRGTAAVASTPGEGSRSGILGRRGSSSSASPVSALKAASASSSTSSHSSSAGKASHSSSASKAESSVGNMESSVGTTESPAGKAEGGRHFAPDELVQGPTYRLSPDRVARAKVREITPADDEQETTRLSSVPRPRAS